MKFFLRVVRCRDTFFFGLFGDMLRMGIWGGSLEEACFCCRCLDGSLEQEDGLAGTLVFFFVLLGKKEQEAGLIGGLSIFGGGGGRGGAAVFVSSFTSS